MIFRKALSTDAINIYALYTSLIGSKGCTWDTSYPALQDIQDDIEHSSLYCLFDSDGLVAAAFAGHSDELSELPWTLSMAKPCDLARIGVRPDRHNKGIGACILSLVMDDAKKRGFDSMRMLVSKSNPYAIAMYDKASFICSGEVYMYGIDFYLYERLL